MNSIIPSDPKPTKEAYLTALRILRENHKVSDDPTGSPLRRAQLFTGEESRITNVTDANVPDSTDPINSFLANIALGGRSERRNIPTPSLPTRNTSLLVPQSPVSETPASQPVSNTPIGNDSSEKLKKSTNDSVQRLSNGSDSTGGIIKFGRKATRRFTMVSNMLPKYKLDEVAKQKIAMALKEINCWSDDEDYEAVKKLKAIEEDSDLSSGSDSDQELSLEALASKKHTHQSVKAMGNTLKDSNLVSKKYRGLHPQTSSKSATIQPTPPAQTSTKERPNLMRPKHTIYQTKQQTAKQAYLEQQKELQRQQAKEIVVKKAVKLIIKLRAEEETQQKRSELAKKYNLSTLAMLSIESIAIARVGKILKQALVLAVDKRIKLNKKSKRRLIRENRAATTIFWCYRKYRVHMLLFCVVKFIRAKALYFKNQEIQEEIDYRMRTAMRRVKEDKQFKVWKSEQSVKSTFPVKPPVSEFSPIIAFTRKNFLANNPVVAPVSVVSPAPIIPMSETQIINFPESGPPASTPGAITIDTSVGNTFLTEPNTSANSRVSSPRPPTSPRGKNAKDNKDTKDKAPAKSPRAQPASPMPVKKEIVKSASKADTTASAGESKLFTTSMSPRNATPAVTTATAAATSNSLVPVVPSKPKPLTKEGKEFNYHRPDLAPFSTMINNLISNNSLFKSQQQSEPSWVDVASVSADYGKVYNNTNNTTNSKLKSPAYAALEKFCGITQEDLERRKLAKNKDLVNLKLKSFGHSIVSL